MKTTATRRVKKAINPLLSPSGALFQTHLSGGGAFLNLAKTIVSVLHKELECGVEKRKYEKLEIMQQGGRGGKRKVKSFLLV